ncbi:unnamed protein product [Calypogeia fissa]
MKQGITTKDLSQTGMKHCLTQGLVSRRHASSRGRSYELQGYVRSMSRSSIRLRYSHHCVTAASVLTSISKIQGHCSSMGGMGARLYRSRQKERSRKKSPQNKRIRQQPIKSNVHRVSPTGAHMPPPRKARASKRSDGLHHFTRASPIHLT